MTKMHRMIAVVAALLVGAPLASQAMASDGWDIFGSSVDLAASITEAAVGAS
jgi:hypothetical protein